MSVTPGGSYSRLDRLLHKWAFSGVGLQKSLADIEDRTYAQRIRPIAITKPIFITSLPRAGTTILLDLLVRHPGMVTHTYRCMPFVLCPILWDAVSRGFRKPAKAIERAHGDGMMVNYDSPEAFEEILWMAFWRKKYGADRISLWSRKDRDPEFEEFFRNHMRKLIAIGLPSDQPVARYVSKNNANIARLPLLRELFPDSILLIPFRDPVDQAGSLLRQHRRFVELHDKDAFTRLYMQGIGHFEFGAGLRPIDFAAVADVPDRNNPVTGDYWLSYWIRAYSHLIRQTDLDLRFFDFDALCAAPVSALEALCAELDCHEAIEHLRGEAASLRPAVHYDANQLGLDPALVAHARALWGTLRSRALYQAAA